MRRFSCAWIVLALLIRCRPEAVNEPATSVFSLTEEIDQARWVYDEARFRSIRKDGSFVNTVTMEGRTERSLTPPVPSEVAFRLQIPERPVLRFATGVDALGASVLSRAVVLELRVEASGERTTVFSESVLHEMVNRWTDQEVDLRAWAGEEVQLTLVSRFPTLSRKAPPALAAWGDFVIADAGAEPRRPSILLVSIDCLRADHVGAYGYHLDTTPEIDALANDAVLFEKAFATAPWTLPSHMSMLTGMLPSLHGATKWEKLDPSVEYLPELLRDAGYRTAGVVSWVYLSQAYGFERGFDVYRVLDDPEASDVVDEAIQELRRGEGRPQFLFVHVYDPHWPYLPPGEFMERLGRPRDISTLLERTSKGSPPADELEREEVQQLYDAEITFADRELGRLFDAMRDQGLYDDALIIITSDHGEAFYEHGYWQHSQTLYDEMIHIPLIMKPPDGTTSSRWQEPVSLVDIFVTIAETAGIDVPESDDGVMARASLARPIEDSRTVLSEVTWRSPSGTIMKVGLRDASNKYMVTLTGPPGDDLGIDKLHDEAFFDLSGDPEERRNVLESHDPAEVSKFRSSLRDFLEAAKAARSLRQGEAVELDDETMRKLETLGYVN